jgi:hypothetical protein
MAYTITVQIIQTNAGTFFRIAEKTCITASTSCVWSEVDGAHVLKMDDSGSSGSLRLVSDTGENFIVTLGLDDYKRWCDIVTDLKPSQTAVVISQEYYDDRFLDREKQRQRQLAAYDITNSNGRKLRVSYPVAEGNILTANVIIE